jgi:isocitrate/isopropylmalate dehydrogenase
MNGEIIAGHGNTVAIPATLIPGDGIGPEIVDAAVRILDSLGTPFARDVQQGGLAGVAAGGDPLPKATRDSIHRTKLALKGPLTTPVGGGFRSINVRLREEFQLYANLRPAHTLAPGGREAVHGSAPDIAGKGLANPTALLLAAGLMLDHVGRANQAERLRGALDEVLNTDKIRTGDLGGSASTRDFTDAVVRRVSAGV